MKKYIITVKDSFVDVDLSGVFFGNNEKEAVKEAKEYYAVELGITEKDIEILNIKEVI